MALTVSNTQGGQNRANMHNVEFLFQVSLNMIVFFLRFCVKFPIFIFSQIRFDLALVVS